MRIRNIALVVGGACVVALSSVVLVACSSDDGTGTPTTGTTPDATATDTGAKGDTSAPLTDAGTGADTATGDDDSSAPSDAGTGADCAPTGTLHPVEAGTGPYCPFSAVGDAGNLTCAFGAHCLEPTSGGSVCSDAASVVDSGTDWECQGPENCAAGSVCCAKANSAGQDPGCSYHFLSHFTGTTCRTSCQAGEMTTCESVEACNGVTGTTCQITHAKGATFGLCL